MCLQIFNWVKDKVINGRLSEKQKKNKKDKEISDDQLPAERCKEEMSDWTNGLLSIGTFGNNSGFTGDSQRYASSETSGFSGFTGDSQRYASSERSSCSQGLSNFTMEEVNKLQKELTRQLNGNSNLGKNLEIEQIAVVDDDDYICQDTNLVSKSEDSTTKMKRKHLTFLLKKMFVCGGGFAKVPGLKCPVPETRMEKVPLLILILLKCRILMNNFAAFENNLKDENELFCFFNICQILVSEEKQQQEEKEWHGGDGRNHREWLPMGEDRFRM